MQGHTIKRRWRFYTKHTDGMIVFLYKETHRHGRTVKRRKDEKHNHSLPYMCVPTTNKRTAGQPTARKQVGGAEKQRANKRDKHESIKLGTAQLPCELAARPVSAHSTAHTRTEPPNPTDGRRRRARYAPLEASENPGEHDPSPPPAAVTPGGASVDMWPVSTAPPPRKAAAIRKRTVFHSRLDADKPPP